MSGYLCGVCKKDEKFDPSWTRHLASLCHQRALAKLPNGGRASAAAAFDDDKNDRSAQILGSPAFSPTLIQFVEYLTVNGGELEEFICPLGTKPIVAHCCFKEPQSLENLLKIKDHQLFEQKMEITRIVNDSPASPSKKRKVAEGSKDKSRSRSFFKGLPIEAQLDKCIEMFGWSADFISEAQKLVNQVVGGMNMKFRKIPFGDLVTGLGLRIRPVLQLLFDVQELSENPDKIKSLLRSCQLSIQKISPPDKKFPLKRTWIVEEKELCIQSLVCNSNSTLRLRYSNALDFEECRLFKFYCQFDARIFPLTFLLAHWATSANLLQTINQAYPNQLIILMTICFLQHKKVVPTVKKLQENCGEERPVVINGAIASFCSDVEIMQKACPNPMASLLNDDGIRAMSLLGLLKDWFGYFSNVDLNESAICPRFGYFLPKRDFQPDSLGKLPEDLARGMEALALTPSSKETKKSFFTQSPLCIQNPFDLSINCGRGVSLEEVGEFQEGCKEAVKIVAELLTKDQPDLTEFISSSVPNFEEIFGNELKKVKTEAVLSTTVSPQKPIYAVPSTHSTSTMEIQGKASTVKEVVDPKPTNPKSRAVATDFSKTETDDKDDADDKEDDEDEDGMSVSGASVEMSEDSRDCTLTLNQNLFNYFARTFQGAAEMKHEKLQLLVLQFILDFNQKFWTNCFGLVFEPKVGQKFWPEDFAQIHYQGKAKTDLTTSQRISEICSKENEINVDFRVRSDGKMIHKIFTENLTVKKWCSNLTNFSLPLYSEVPPSRLQEIKNVSYLASQSQLQFECRLIGGVSKSNGQCKTPLATLQMNASSSNYGLNQAKIQIIKKLYRKLGQSYIDKMVKRWLSEGADFDETKALNFVQSRNQKWNSKRNKKAKQRERQAQQQKQALSNQNLVNNVSNSVHGSYSQLLKAPCSTMGNVTRFAFPNMNFRPQQQQYRPQFPYSSQQSHSQRANQKQQIKYEQYYPQKQFDGDADDRILRNPGPQGMRTFYPPKQRLTHPPEYKTCFSENNESCDQKNPQLPFQGRKSAGNIKYEDRGSNNDNYSSFNNTTKPEPPPRDDNSKPIRPLFEDDIPQKLLPNPRYNNSLPEQLFKNEIPSIFPNPKFNAKPKREPYNSAALYNNYAADQNRAENYGTPIQVNKSREQWQAYEELFTRRPAPAPADFRYNAQAPTANYHYPNVKKSPSKLIDFDEDPRMSQYPSQGQQQYSSNYNQGQRQRQRQRHQRPNSPPYVPSSATQFTGGFVRSGFLTNQQENEDDELDIEYDLDPRSCSSPPPPPPIRNFKLGNPFPVPKRPAGVNSQISRNTTGYQTTDGQRDGYGVSSGEYDYKFGK